MAFFNWKPEYSVGNANIDGQHKALVGYVNDLFEALSAGKGRGVLGQVLANLAHYTVEHFNQEEAVMRTAGYPDLAAHQEKHRKMKAKVASLMDEFNNGTLSNPIQITDFLKNWLKKHILETDMAYAPYLND